MTRHAFLHFGKPGEGPFETVRVEMRETEAPRYGRTVSGYGARIPTPFMVRLHGRWRRVYAAVWGNWPSLYIGKPGAWQATVDPD